jgi:group I intron endonuclease
MTTKPDELSNIIDMRTRYLYCITNKINGKRYIGQTLDPENRWDQHQRNAEANAPKMVISQSIKKYNVSNFSFNVLACCEGLDISNTTEIFLIKHEGTHISTGNGYNVSWGGYCFSMRGSQHGMAILDEFQVMELVELCCSGMPKQEVADKFGILLPTVYSILRGKTWAHITNISYKESTHMMKSDATDSFQEGENHIMAKLTNEQVLKIVELNKSGQTDIELSKTFRVAVATISAIIRGDRWSKITGVEPNKRIPAAKGSRNQGSILNEEQVMYAVWLMNRGYKINIIARLLECSEGIIYRIQNGKTWSHLTGIVPTNKRSTPTPSPSSETPDQTNPPIIPANSQACLGDK